MRVQTRDNRRRNPVMELRPTGSNPTKVRIYHFPEGSGYDTLYRIEGCSSVHVDKVLTLFEHFGYVFNRIGDEFFIVTREV